MQHERITQAISALALVFTISACSEAPTAPDMPQLAMAPDFTCSGIVVGGTYGNVVVVTGTTCQMQSVTVQGSIKVQPGAGLFMPTPAPDVAQSTVAGDVDAVKAIHVDVRFVQIGGHFSSNESGRALSIRNTVGGKIQIVKTTPGASSLAIATQNTVLNGDIKMEGNNSNDVNVSGNNVVKGNVLVYQNQGPLKRVNNNTISGSLDCKANTAPFTGVNNTAAKKQGQCLNF